jgi:glutamine cyclotransferase
MPKTNLSFIEKARINPLRLLVLPALLVVMLYAAMLFAMPISAADGDTDSINSSLNAASIPVFGYEVVNTYPHDPSAFTQGLVYDDGVLYEGTGLNGQSTLRRVDVATGRVLQQTNLSREFFGEGIAIWKDRLMQLTWLSNQGFVYGKENLTRIGNFSYPTEGWGLTSDGKKLIMSDGTETLYFLDPVTLARVGEIKVTAIGEPVKGLNELEYINGMIYANMWPRNRIAIISPDNGSVVGVINLQGILKKSDIHGHKVDVLNGIAYDVKTDRLFVTGKRWPRLFEIRLTTKG